MVPGVLFSGWQEFMTILVGEVVFDSESFSIRLTTFSRSFESVLFAILVGSFLVVNCWLENST